MMPSKSPLWSSNWIANNCLIGLSNILRLSFHHEEYISNSTCCFHLNSNISCCDIILNIPILSSNKISKDSKPSFITSLTHKEWMNTTLFFRCPQAICTCLHKQIRSFFFKRRSKKTFKSCIIKTACICTSNGIIMVNIICQLHVSVNGIQNCSIFVFNINCKCSIRILIPCYII